LGVLRFDPNTRAMLLASVHPGVQIQDVIDNTGWPLKVAPDVSQTPEPTAVELAMLRRFDPQRFWTRD
jgi:glutaconate CoA-transferase subunit B